MKANLFAAFGCLLLVIVSIDARSARRHKNTHANVEKEAQSYNAKQNKVVDEAYERHHEASHKKHRSPHPDPFPGDFWQYPYPYYHPVYNCLPVPQCPCENEVKPQAANALEEGAKEKSKKPKGRSNKKQLVPSHYYGPPSAGWGGFCPGQTGSGWGSPYWYRSSIPMRPEMESRRFEIMQRGHMPYVNGWNSGWAGRMDHPSHAPIGYAIRSFSGMPQGTATGGQGRPYDQGISHDFGTGLSHGWGTQFPSTGRWWESDDRSSGLDQNKEKNEEVQPEAAPISDNGQEKETRDDQQQQKE